MSSELNINRKTFLEQEELRRFQQFLQESVASAVTLGNTTSWGVLRTDFSGNENDFKVEAGTNSGTIQIANESKAVDNDELLAVQSPIDNIAVTNDSVWRWVRISHRYRRHEVGTISIDINGNMVGSGTLFSEVLRGQATDVPVNIKFLKADLSPANNSGVYQIVDIVDDQNAILTSDVSFQAESDLFYVAIGSTPIDEIISSEQLEGLYKYNDCLIELVDEVTEDTPPTVGFVQDKTFYIARVQNTGTLLTIQDKRTEYWGFNIIGISDKLDKTQNLNDLTDIAAARANLGVLSSEDTEFYYLQQANNLNDLDDAATARVNLGVETPSELNSRYLKINDNLNDLGDAATARTNLDVYSKNESDEKIRFKSHIYRDAGVPAEQNYTAVIGDDIIFTTNTGGGSVNVTLPLNSDFTGKTIKIIHYNGNLGAIPLANIINLSIQTSGILNGKTLVQAVEVHYDGVAWNPISATGES